MQRSTHRILTTHVGSLARPDALIPLLRLKERGQPYDGEVFARLVREAVADMVRKQVEAGIDIVTDGEQGKAGGKRGSHGGITVCDTMVPARFHPSRAPSRSEPSQ